MNVIERLGSIGRIPTDLWLRIAPTPGEEKRPGTRGRPPIPFRKVVDGILYVLRTGCQWKALPREYGSGSTCHRRFRQWAREGAFERVWARLLEEYDDARGIGWW